MNYFIKSSNKKVLLINYNQGSNFIAFVKFYWIQIKIEE